MTDRTKTPDVFRPPINRSMRELDRSFFSKMVSVAAAVVHDPRHISNVRKKLEKNGEMLRVYAVGPIRDWRGGGGGGSNFLSSNNGSPSKATGAKCVLLSPHVQREDKGTWSSELVGLNDDNIVSIESYDLKLTYDDYGMHDILEAILPEFPAEEKETPAGFAQVGHVAHINLLDQYLPYRYLIGQVLVDKNPMMRTVINKTKDVGTESIFRTFPYEVLAGPDDLNVTLSHGGCTFEFDFSKVYWNTRLGSEHERLVSKFQPGEAVCDVMAGVGPFALPAGKKRVFVRANDLNPDSYASLQHNIERNRLQSFVTASCKDGRAFIREETEALARTRRRWRAPPPRVSRNAVATKAVLPKSVDSAERQVLEEPATFDHYVMNLPATAIEFLDAFRGIYRGREDEFDLSGESTQPRQSSTHNGVDDISNNLTRLDIDNDNDKTSSNQPIRRSNQNNQNQIPDQQQKRKLPLIHLHTFQARKPTPDEQHQDLLSRVSHHLGHPLRFSDPDIELHEARLVSPNKFYYCVTFRLPAAVAF